MALFRHAGERLSFLYSPGTYERDERFALTCVARGSMNAVRTAVAGAAGTARAIGTARGAGCGATGSALAN